MSRGCRIQGLWPRMGRCKESGTVKKVRRIFEESLNWSSPCGRERSVDQEEGEEEAGAGSHHCYCSKPEETQFSIHCPSKIGESSYLCVWRAWTNRYSGESTILRWVNDRIVGVQVQRQLWLRLLQLWSRVRRSHLELVLKKSSKNQKALVTWPEPPGRY